MMKELDFKMFWDAYGLKRDRIAAERAWKRLSAKDKAAALDGIERYRKDCRTRGISMMYAQGYINHRRWEDEVETEIHPQSVPHAEGLFDMETW